MSRSSTPASSRRQVPIRITTAPISAAQDQQRRQRRYLISMSIRVVCFILAVVTTGWIRGVMIAGAVFLPYVAVVMANAMSPRVEGPDLPGTGTRHRELGGGDQ